MDVILLTKSGFPILGQIAIVLGWLMNGIYKALEVVGIQNIGLCFIIFSIVVYALMTPLQIKQQKFSKLSSIMQPELQKVNNKYKGKKDQASMQKMQEETQAVYAKYGVSPTGSCVQMLIQMPILLSLYQVIYKIPGYVGAVKEVLIDATNDIISVNGYSEILQSFIKDNGITRVKLAVDSTEKVTSNSVVDLLYSLSPSQWKSLADMPQFSGFSDVIESTAKEMSHMQNFLGLNIADQPLQIIKTAFAAGSFLVVIGALLIPFLSWLTQVISLKTMPQANAAASGDGQDAMMNSMKTMNTFMPLMSAVFCFTFPVGLGIYWIASAVVRTIQQIIINKKLEQVDIQSLIDANVKKMEEKRAKAGLPPQKITNQAHKNVRNIEREEQAEATKTNSDRAQKVAEAYQKAESAKTGSITAKANMVKEFEERNKRKSGK